MHLVKGQIGLELARNDRVDLLADAPERSRRVAAVTRLLPPDDRRLVELIVARGFTHRAAAADLRIAPGVASRRLQRLRALIASPTIRAIADHIDSLAQPARQIAIDHFFARVAVIDIARQRGLARRSVQSQLDYIRGWARALHRQSVLAPAD